MDFMRIGQLTCTGAMLVVATCLSIGCSQDKHTFPSTAFLPVTVSLRDLVGKEVIWSREVPVGYKLVLDLDAPGEMAPMAIGKGSPTKMSWSIKSIAGYDTIEKGKMDLPGIPVMIEPTYRQAPEYPSGYTPPGSKAQPALADLPLPDPQAPAPLPEAPAPDEDANEPPDPDQQAAPAEEPPPADDGEEPAQ